MSNLIIQQVKSVDISLRGEDGYVNATAMCQAAGKPLSNYLRAKRYQDFADKLAGSLRIRRDLLIVMIMDGPNEERGTWVHPRIAIHLAQWCSTDVELAVAELVDNWRTRPAPPVKLLTLEESLVMNLELLRANKAKDEEIIRHKNVGIAVANYAVVQKAEIKAKEAVIELQAKDVELLHDLMRNPAETMSLAEAAPIIIPEWCQGAGGQNTLAELLRSWKWLKADLSPHSKLKGRGYFTASGWSPTGGGTWSTVTPRLTHKAVAEARRKILTEGYPAHIQLPSPKKIRKDVRSTGYLDGFEPQEYVDPEDVLRPGEELGPDV